MNTVHNYLISTAHVSAEHAPYYVGWVRQAYEIAGEKLTTSLFPGMPNKKRYRNFSLNLEH
jgi:hypothetical protein